MTLSNKWKTAAAGLLALALLGGSAGAANAAPGDALASQPNGSDGGLFLFDMDTGNPIIDPAHEFGRDDQIFAAGSPTDYNVRITGSNPASIASSTQVYTYVSSAANLRASAKNSWEAYKVSGPYSSTDNGAFMVNVSAGDNAPSLGLDGIFSDVGGTYYLGMAFTKNNGVTVDSAIYRTMTVLAGDKYTLSPIEYEGAPPAPTAPTEAQLESAAGTAADIASLVAPVAADGTTLTIDAGVANANKTLNVGAYSTYTDLGTVTLDANGQGTVEDVPFTDNSPHTLVLWETDGTLVAFGTFAMNYTSVAGSSNPLTVAVTTSEKFELVAPAAGTVDLGAVKRNATTTPVALGEFTVIDDRSTMLGWDLNVSANDFVNGANTIAKNALGYEARSISTLPTGVALGASKAAGAGSFGAALSGAANTSTTESGLAFDLDLTFKSPIDAAAGTYASTLTLDLQSK